MMIRRGTISLVRNKMDAAGEIVRGDYQQETLRHAVWGHPSCHREKRAYNQKDEQYWKEGGIQEI